jgi:hypothetical protein
MFDRLSYKRVFGFCLLALMTVFVLPVQADEGYDPMLQISNQFAKPNVLIVLDVTGSMAYEQTSSTNVGVDTFGLPDFAWTSSVSPAVPGRPTATQGASCGTDSRGRTLYNWTCTVPDVTYTVTYTLTPTYNDASRLDVFKNALGNSVPLYSGNTVTWPSTWPVTYTGWTYIGGGQWTKTVSVPGYNTTVCQRTAPTCNNATSPSTGSAPFTPSWTVPDYSTSPVTKALLEGVELIQPSRLPQNLVGLNKDQVNWGLMTFSTDGISLRQAVVADDNPSTQTTVANKIQAYLKPSSVSTTIGGTTYDGLGAGGTTCTSKALDYAKRYLAATWTSGGPGGTADPKQNCGRLYANILVTDGQSNMCNLSDCTSGSSSYWSCESSTAPTNWDEFPAGRTDENFLEAADNGTACTSCRIADTTPVPVRTFVIGVSNEVARCELNLAAFLGRTDANSPNGDAGMRIEKDFTVVSGSNAYRLPVNVPTNFKAKSQAYMDLTSLPSPLAVGTSTATSNYRYVTSTCTTSCQDYAFFATNPTAVYDAFATILGAIAAGDYTTAAPVASSTSTTGTLAILPSTEYPLWKGHLYAFDLTKAVGATGYYKWDAGYNLRYSTGSAANPTDTSANTAYVSPANRKIYTWNPSTLALVQVTTANLTALNTACGSCGLTTSDVNFMIGYDGSSGTSTTVRPWVLSSTINSTPAIVQSPEKFKQNNLEAHDTFENTYKNRVPLVWMGADDGMLHAFKLSDGSEALALIPPNLLAFQRTLRANYVSYTSSKAPTGQPSLPSQHLYGLASSPRYGDVYFSADSAYKTLMLATEGPGGNLIAGIDVTDPVGQLASSADPVTVKWNKTGSNWTGLYGTWSTPAMGASAKNSGSTPSTWSGLSGAGFNPSSTVSSPVVPKAFTFDATTGNLKSTQPGLSNHSTPPNALVGNQTFADSVIYQMSASAYYPDNVVDLALQADLNGQIWFIPGTAFGTCSVGIDATTKASQQQPIYYPPAVNAYTDVNGNAVDLYAFGSGTVYEKSANVTGTNVGTSGYFTPSIYLVVKPQSTAAASTTQILRIPVNALYIPEDLTNHSTDPASPTPCSLPTNWETVGTYNQVLCRLNTHHLMGHRTQITAPPALFVPIAGVTGDPVAVFLLYDPDQGCAGEAYIVQFNFNTNGSGGSSAAPALVKTLSYDAGVGAASGFAVAGSSVIIAKSAVGSGKQAGVSKVPGLNPTAGMSNPVPVWWRELK